MKENIIVTVVGVLGVGIFLFSFGDMIWDFVSIGKFFSAQRKDQKVLKTGLPATATIVDRKQTNESLNDQPIVKFKLKVKPPTELEYEIEIQQVVPLTELSYFEVGAKREVRYDPGTHHTVLVTRKTDL